MVEGRLYSLDKVAASANILFPKPIPVLSFLSCLYPAQRLLS